MRAITRARARVFGGINFGDLVKNSPIRQIKIPAKVSGYTVVLLAVMRRSHCTSASNWELPLLCSPALQGTSSLENTYDFLQILLFILATIKGQDLYYVG